MLKVGCLELALELVLEDDRYIGERPCPKMMMMLASRIGSKEGNRINRRRRRPVNLNGARL